MTDGRAVKALSADCFGNMETVAGIADEWARPKRRLHDCFSFSASATSCTDTSQLAGSIIEDHPICWICLDLPRPEACLLQPCKCPRFAHAHCLARWQLQSAGSRKETNCEFCDGMLPDWKKALTPTCGADAPAVMNVNFDGRTYSFEVKPGAEGYRRFTEAIRRAFALPEDSELNITFTCDEPTSVPVVEQPPPVVAGLTHIGSLLTLQGAGAYDAAVHCASVSAARRSLHPTSSGSLGSASSFPMHQLRTHSSPSTPVSFHSSPSQRGAASYAGGEERSEQPNKRRFRGVAHKLRLAINDIMGSKSSH